MSTAKRQRILTWALSAYAVLSLGSMATMGIGAALVGAALLANPKELGRALKSAVREPAYRRFRWAALSLLAAIALSLVGAWVSPLGYGGRVIEVRPLPDLAKAWYLLWPLLLSVALVSVGDSGRKTVLRAWLITLGVLAVIGVIQFFTGWPREQRIPGTEHFHATLFLGHHLSVASILIFPFFAALDLWVTRGGKPVLPRGVLGAIAAGGALCLFLTYSRILWAALPAGVFVWLLWVAPKKLKLPALGAAVVLVVIIGLQPAVSRRLTDPGGIVERRELWKANLEFFKQRPLTGVGWHHNNELSGFYFLDKYRGADVFSGHAHNNFLDQLSGTGLLGTASWIFWCGVVLVLLVGQARAGVGFARGLACAWVVFHLNGLTQVNFWEAKVLHQTCWAVSWSLAWALTSRR